MRTRQASFAMALVLAASCSSGDSARTGPYFTNFPGTENPISEGGHWVNGKTAGLDWADVATVPGLAFGLQSGSNGYDDATALLTGTWGPDQTVTATVRSVNPMGGSVYEEVEIRLRSSLSAHLNTGYEIFFRCVKDSSSYVQIVRWNGPLNDFTYLADNRGMQYGISDGDVISATAIGNVITAYLNGVQVARVIDNTYPAGSPGMGFFLQGTTGVNGDFGFTSFTATDGAGRSSSSSATRLGVID